jgi:hypothetical protein
MLVGVLILLIAFVARAAILATLLWIMIKIQKLQYNIPGLLASAALACGLDMIPHVGHYLAVPTLYICIWRVTREDLFPDAVFTVAISYALMFGVDLFIIGSLMGDLRPSARSADFGGTVREEVAAVDDPEEETNAAPAIAQKLSKPTAATNSAAAAQRSPITATNSIKSGPTRSEQIANQFTFKGLTRNSEQSALVVHTGTKTYTLLYGQPEQVQTTLGLVSVRFEELGDDYVVLNVDGESIKLSLR